MACHCIQHSQLSHEGIEASGPNKTDETKSLKKYKKNQIYGEQKYTYLNYKEEFLCFCFSLLEQEKIANDKWKKWLYKNR